MYRIYKYRLKVQEKQDVVLPAGAMIIRVGNVEGECFLWAMVNPDEPQREIVQIEMYKTGQDIENAQALKHLGECCLFIGQELCLYVFERLYRVRCSPS